MNKSATPARTGQTDKIRRQPLQDTIGAIVLIVTITAVVAVILLAAWDGLRQQLPESMAWHLRVHEAEYGFGGVLLVIICLLGLVSLLFAPRE